MAGRNDNHPRVPLEGLDAKLDTLRLVRDTAVLVEKMNRGFKFTLGDPTMRDAFTIGHLVHRGLKAPMRCPTELRGKIDLLAKARRILDDLEFDVEVGITAGRVTANEKAIWDIQFRKVRPQLDSLVTSLSRRLADTEAKPNEK